MPDGSRRSPARGLQIRSCNDCGSWQEQGMSFTLDPKLDADTLAVGDLALSTVLLMNDMRFPWLILVPKRANMADLIDLAEPDRSMLLAEISQASEALKALFAPDKLNVAALGNVVRQLHVHVIARFVSDEAWPKPIWGQGAAIAYPPHMAGPLIDRLRNALELETA
jgi:diadenosine tetraphosphate (Ap4A) HIT family hydrolase